MAWRKRLLPKAGEDFEWVNTSGDVLHFRPPGGWHCVTNFGNRPVKLPDGDVLRTSAKLIDGKLQHDATAWVLAS